MFVFVSLLFINQTSISEYALERLQMWLDTFECKFFGEIFRFRKERVVVQLTSDRRTQQVIVSSAENIKPKLIVLLCSLQKKWRSSLEFSPLC
jgi:hypothetical protein